MAMHFAGVGLIQFDVMTQVEGFDGLEGYQGLRAIAGARGMTAGRNDPCPCGSGRKFKACLLRRLTDERL